MLKLDAMEAALPHRFTFEEYAAMEPHGIIAPDVRVELLDGLVFDKMTAGSRHLACVARLTRLLILRFVSRAHVHVQGAIRLPPMSAPEPDVAVLQACENDYANRVPGPEDVIGVVEVADSSLSIDRGEKLRLYAHYRIGDYWIANLVDDCIEVYREPHDLGYAERRIFPRDGRVAFLQFPDEEFAVSDILPPALEQDARRPSPIRTP